MPYASLGGIVMTELMVGYAVIGTAIAGTIWMTGLSF